jgi:hypothetical protein
MLYALLGRQMVALHQSLTVKTLSNGICVGLGLSMHTLYHAKRSRRAQNLKARKADRVRTLHQNPNLRVNSYTG